MIKSKTHEELITGKNIFEDAVFGEHYVFDNCDAIYLEKDDYGLHKLAVHRHIKYKDGSEKDFADIMLVHSNGFAYCDTDDNGNVSMEHYVIPCNEKTNP